MAKPPDDLATLVRLLERGPLYAEITVTSLVFPMEKWGIGIGERRWFKIPDSIRVDLHCPRCDRERTFVPLAEQWPSHDDEKWKVNDADGWKFQMGHPLFLPFTCSSCIVQVAAFALLSELRGLGAVFQKIGHGPNPGARLDPRVAKALGAHAGLFRQGLTSEFYGLGVGAFGYFRQVAENIVDGLLKKLRAEAEMNNEAELLSAIDRLNPKAPASDRIRLVKDHLPAALRPGGLNPLGAIYKALSQGIHAGTDEECLAEAKELRVAMTFLVQELAERTEKREEYLAAVRGLGTPKT